MRILPVTPPDLSPVEAGIDHVLEVARFDVVAGARAFGLLLKEVERAPMLLTPTAGARIAQACATLAVLEERAGGAALNVACLVTRLDRAWRDVFAPAVHRASHTTLAWAAVGAAESTRERANELLTTARARDDATAVLRALHAVRRRFGATGLQATSLRRLAAEAVVERTLLEAALHGPATFADVESRLRLEEASALLAELLVWLNDERSGARRAAA